MQNITAFLREQEQRRIEETQAERKRMKEDPEFYKTGWFNSLYRIKLSRKSHEKTVKSKLHFGIQYN